MYCPATRPVTIADQRRIEKPFAISSDVTLPVTYITFASNSPLAAPLTCDDANARHSKSPPCASAWKATRVVTGTGAAPPVPPSIIVLPAPETRRCFPASPLAITLVDAPTTARAMHTAPTQSHQLRTRGRARS